MLIVNWADAVLASATAASIASNSLCLNTIIFPPRAHQRSSRNSALDRPKCAVEVDTDMEQSKRATWYRIHNATSGIEPAYINIQRGLAEQHEDHSLHRSVFALQVLLHFADRDLRGLFLGVPVHSRADRGET